MLVESVGNGVHFGPLGEDELVVAEGVLVVEVTNVENELFDQIDLIGEAFKGFAGFGKLELVLNCRLELFELLIEFGDGFVGGFLLGGL